MKKYKLIKEYPGSPKLGTEIEKKTIYSDKWMFTRDCNLFPVTSGTPDDYPEFWEQVIELCVPIGTKFKHRGGNQIYFISKLEDNIVTVSWFKNRCNTLTYHLKNVNNWFKEGTWIIYEEKEYEILEIITNVQGRKSNVQGYSEGYITSLLNCDQTKIHSIKRTSDGEIFTIGDRIKYLDFVFKLEKIEFEACPADKGTRKLSFIHDNNILGKWLDLQKIEKAKESLFITEDGIEIKDKDQLIYLVNPLNCAMVVIPFSQWDETRLIFAELSNAEEYIKLNKPMFSYMDILNGYKACINFNSLHGDVVETKTFIEYLKNTANERYKK